MTVLFYPEIPSNVCMIKKYGLDKTDIKYHNNINQHYDIVFYWQTFFWSIKGEEKYKQDEFILNINSVINKGCYNTTKTRVEEIFKTGLNVDPEQHIGDCIRKSETHTGEVSIVKCPHKKEKGFIYQIPVIETDIDRNIIDYRVYFSGQIDFIMKRKKSSFNTTVGYEIVEDKDVLTSEQISYITDKCNEYGLNFVELDILKEGNKAYVIDVNAICGISQFTIESEYIQNRYKKSFVDFLNRQYQPI